MPKHVKRGILFARDALQIVIYLCFVFSGATGLIFENLWVRMLTLVFGSTSLAVSSVLTAYMGGLALGSWLFGRWADRIRDPPKRPLRLEAVKRPPSIVRSPETCSMGNPPAVSKALTSEIPRRRLNTSLLSG